MDLKKNGKVFTSKSVGTGPSSDEKRIYRSAGGLTKVERHWSREAVKELTGLEVTNERAAQSLFVKKHRSDIPLISRTSTPVRKS